MPNGKHLGPGKNPPQLLDSMRWKGMRIGLLGGSFNPPHEGHMHISLAALKGLHLDCVWWLVTPQNPLKSTTPLPLDERLQLCRNLAIHPKILITDIEREMGTAITYFSVSAIKRRFPKTDFVWISGMDNALSLHHWHHWQALLKQVCMVHLTRSPARSLVKSCPLRLLSMQKHVVIDRGGRLPLLPGVTYWMMQKKMLNISSSEIRNNHSKTIS